MQLDFATIPRYKGPNPPHQRRPTMDRIGIPFLALRIIHRKIGHLMIVRALDHTHKHPAVALAYHDEIETFKATPLTICECVGGGRMNAAGGDLDLYDCSTTYGSWIEAADDIVVAFTEAMERGELIARNIKPYPEYHPSKFAALQGPFNAMHPNTGVQVKEDVVLWPARDAPPKKRKSARHVTV